MAIILLAIVAVVAGLWIADIWLRVPHWLLAVATPIGVLALFAFCVVAFLIFAGPD